jgi:hypothetical protein
MESVENQCCVCKNASKLKCGRCHSAQYCSALCQKTDFANHKKSCLRKEAVRCLKTFVVDSMAQRRRYLWTDAFAVVSLVEIGERELASELVVQVESTLGLPDESGNPIGRGLRIGKKLKERGVDEPYDRVAEWDRDGVYYHYITKWAWAMGQLGDEKRKTQASEMLRFCTSKFICGSRMHWKMSLDLSRSLVPSQGQHDALDGYLTLRGLGVSEQDEAVQALRRIIAPHALDTDDALGIGGLLMDAARCEDDTLRELLLAAARRSLAAFEGSGDLRRSAAHRLAFRELGLCIGAAMLARRQGGEMLKEAQEICDRIMSFWGKAEHRDTHVYKEHQDINEVMRATAVLLTY